MPETESTTRQWSLIRHWLTDLKKIPALYLVWLEGGLADGQGSPYFDIDIRLQMMNSSSCGKGRFRRRMRHRTF